MDARHRIHGRAFPARTGGGRGLADGEVTDAGWGLAGPPLPAERGRPVGDLVVSPAGSATSQVERPPAATAVARRDERLEAVEALRGLAALLVVVGHVLGDAVHFGVGPGVVPDWQVWGAGVDIFFVISGFIMVWTFGDRFGGAGAVRDFAVRRLSRIVPLYWAITGVTALLLLLWPGLFDRSTFGWSHLLLSLLFVPHDTPAGELLPMVGVGWTLNYEMFFYLVFGVGLLFPIGVGLGLVVLVMVGSFLGAALAPSDGPASVRFLADPIVLDFLLGVGFAQLLRVKGFRRPVMLWTSAAALAAAAFLLGLVGESRFIVAGLPALAVVSAALALYPRTTGPFGPAVLALGAASYALYLFHPLVLSLTKAAMVQVGSGLGLPPIQLFGVYAATAMLLSVAVALLVRAKLELPLLRLCRRGPWTRRPISGARA